MAIVFVVTPMDHRVKHLKQTATTSYLLTILRSVVAAGETAFTKLHFNFLPPHKDTQVILFHLNSFNQHIKASVYFKFIKAVMLIAVLMVPGIFHSC